MLKEYVEEQNVEGSSEDGDQSDEVPELTTFREDFDSMVNQFLNDYEILGRKMRPKLEGETGPAQLSVLRQAMAEDPRIRINIDDEDLLVVSDSEDKNEKWDCETILSALRGFLGLKVISYWSVATYTNFENHPRLIRAWNSKPAPKIQLDHRTGLPSILSAEKLDKTSTTRLKFVQESETPKEHDTPTGFRNFNTIPHGLTIMSSSSQNYHKSP